MASKYKNKKIEVDGITFDSRKEAKRWLELRQLEQAGEITDLQRQVKFVLIPSQYIDVPIDGHRFEKKCVERECSYKADFVYKDSFGAVCVEDSKGFKTKDYIIKRKLLLYVHGIQIKEV